MKKLLLILFVFPLMSFTTESDHEKFIGKWIGEDKGEIGYINFDNEGYAFFEMQGRIFGGKEFIFDGKKGKMTYEVNSKTNPIQLDFVITKLEDGEQKRLLCIVEFSDNNTMKMALNFNDDRPIVFDQKNSITLKRQ